jgi:hypothetical protein
MMDAMTFWQAYRTVALWALQGLAGGVVASIPLVAAWYLAWRGWYAAAVAVVIAALLIAIAVSARSLQRRSS